MNISGIAVTEEKIANFLSILSQPVRIQILRIIGLQEACVCHLEAYLGLRQAAISQHLMAMRKSGLLTTRRDGRNIFYRLAKPEILDFVRQAALLSGNTADNFDGLSLKPITPCPCPHCNPDKAEGLSCTPVHDYPDRLM